jgi:hypothetical protein
VVVVVLISLFTMRGEVGNMYLPPCRGRRRGWRGRQQVGWQRWFRQAIVVLGRVVGLLGGTAPHTTTTTVGTTGTTTPTARTTPTPTPTCSNRMGRVTVRVVCAVRLSLRKVQQLLAPGTDDADALLQQQRLEELPVRVLRLVS